MFFHLISRNSKRNRKENRLFFSSLLISILAFYILLSLSHQDIILFLQQMESDAVNRLLQMIPLFYGVTLFLLFFLVYFASKYQLECRSHEFGIYLMIGMKRSKLFFLLLLEDFWSSLFSLGIGIPIAILLSELISLITARLVGIGILGHQFTFSLQAVLWTVIGFLFIKLIAFFILSGKISVSEIGKLLSPAPKQNKRYLPNILYLILLFLGILFLGIAYYLAIRGFAWSSVPFMGITLLFGLIGTFCLFYGLQIFLEFLANNKGNQKKKALSTFTFRQLQEHVIFQSNALSISSLLILAALCFFGFGMLVVQSHTAFEEHILDYTIEGSDPSKDILKILHTTGCDSYFDTIFEVKTGSIYRENGLSSIQLHSIIAYLEQEPISEERDQLLQNLSYQNTSCYIIGLSGYNQLLTLAGKDLIQLSPNQAAFYIGQDFTSAKKSMIMQHILDLEPEIQINGEPYTLTGTLQTTNLVADRSITLSFALILTDTDFERLTAGEYNTYWNTTLTPNLKQQGLIQAITQVNQKLMSTGLIYESYLKNMGRQLFYLVAGSYITLYLAIVFLVVSNTILGVQFLMQQQETGRRYRILIQLGSSYSTLCQSSNRQIRWYFGIPILIAAINSLFGVASLYTGLLPSSLKGNYSDYLWIAAAMIFFLCMVEYAYLLAVSKASCSYILSLMEPERKD